MVVVVVVVVEEVLKEQKRKEEVAEVLGVEPVEASLDEVVPDPELEISFLEEDQQQQQEKTLPEMEFRQMRVKRAEVMPAAAEELWQMEMLPRFHPREILRVHQQLMFPREILRVNQRRLILPRLLRQELLEQSIKVHLADKFWTGRMLIVSPSRIPIISKKIPFVVGAVSPNHFVTIGEDGVDPRLDLLPLKSRQKMIHQCRRCVNSRHDALLHTYPSNWSNTFIHRFRNNCS